MKILKRIGLGFLGLIVLLAIWIAANSIDDRELSEQAKEMLKPVPDVTPEENGYEVVSYMNKSDFHIFEGDGMRTKVNQYLNGTDWDDVYPPHILEERHPWIADIEQAVQRPIFKFPTGKSGITGIPFYAAYYDISRLLNLKALQEIHGNQPDAAIETIRMNITFCQKVMTEEDHYLLSFMIGQSCLANAISMAHRISTEYKLDKEQYTSLKNALSLVYPYQSDKFDQIFASELRFINSLFEEKISRSLKERIDQAPSDTVNQKIFAYTGNIFPEYYNHPHSFINSMTPKFKAAASNSINYCQNIPPVLRQKIETEYDFDNPFIAYRMRKFDDWYYGEYFERRCLAHTYVDAVSTIISIHAYQQDHNALPATLNELVPEYLDRLPIDYFNGEPLKYSPEHKWLYSVGTDYKDDGGSELGYTRGRCYKPDEKNRCDMNPTFPINWNDYPASVR